MIDTQESPCTKLEEQWHVPFQLGKSIYLFSLVIADVQSVSQDSSCKGRTTFINAVKWFLTLSSQLQWKWRHMFVTAVLRTPQRRAWSKIQWSYQDFFHGFHQWSLGQPLNLNFLFLRKTKFWTTQHGNKIGFSLVWVILALKFKEIR